MHCVKTRSGAQCPHSGPRLRAHCAQAARACCTLPCSVAARCIMLSRCAHATSLLRYAFCIAIQNPCCAHYAPCRALHAVSRAARRVGRCTSCRALHALSRATLASTLPLGPARLAMHTQALCRDTICCIVTQHQKWALAHSNSPTPFFLFIFFSFVLLTVKPQIFFFQIFQ